MLQYPFYKDLTVFAEANPDLIDLPVDNITDLMLKLMPTVDEVFDACYWRGTGFNCTDILRLQRTEEGFCYSFNSKTSERMAKNIEYLSNIEDDSQSVKKVKSILSATSIISDLTFIRSHLSEFPNSITKLEKQNSTLNYQINVVETVRDGLKTIENEKGHILYEKFKSVFDKNPGYNILKVYNDSINGNDVDLKENPAIISCYKPVACLSHFVVLQRNVQVSEEELGDPKWNAQDFMNCSCPHPCSFVGYTTEIRNYAKDFLAHTQFPHAYTHIEVHYKERFAISYLRSMMYTTQDLLVTFGGMASLFLGCSLVSVVEIIYVIYKSLIMLKHKYTKVQTVSKQDQQLIPYRRHHNMYHFCRPLYKPPNITLPEICEKDKY
ncbi:unnamed protein product [Macrosiphum euphorbiae]|uniref:Sodium channel protein Nach n=1 Tax=Macrosiphum euphorbiae TaxID=13131 RepID=A0AAV0WVG9_9HEMI|nr:unnamed protein product [Macrosiphum euphorbiae]